MDMIDLERFDLQNQMDPFEKLSTELILCIFSSLTSAEELWSLLSASRHCWDTFNACPVHSLDLILKNGTVHPCMHSVINFVFNLQAGGMLPPSYHHLRHIDSAKRYEELNRNVSPAFVRRFVTIMRKIHALAHIILDNCMTNLWMLKDKLRPRELEHGERDLAHYLDIYHNLGEETRVVLGLRLYELHASMLGANNQTGPPWGHAMLGQIDQRFRPVSCFFRATWMSTLWTIQHGLDIMNLPEDERSGPYDLYLPLTIALPPVPKGGMEFGLQCTTERQNYADESGLEHRRAMAQELHRRPLVSRFLTSARAVAPVHMALHRLPITEYLKTGLLIWDHEKVYDLGLLPWSGTTREELFRYWRNLLPDKVVLQHADTQAQEKVRFWFRSRLGGGRMILPAPTDGALYEDLYAQDDASGEESEEFDADSESRNSEDAGE
ncbi:hypothetical protein NQ176_g3020 [Zarea fungicola]|uniref:Uncharacterized protein n=1 Tax=Zarea fungicola TaxID=93591 RepID=A0ACC1NKK5_9HYPO|nr:hypothetical protein NQ176_g3020 [Lecanicillium fungicola]